PQRAVERRGDVGQRIDHCAIEIEDRQIQRCHRPKLLDSDRRFEPTGPPFGVNFRVRSPMSSAAKKSDRRPPAATDAGAHRRHVAGDRLRETMSGLPLAGVYGPSDLAAGWSYDERLGAPGRFPFTRGPHETMFRGMLWMMRIFSVFGTPD